MTIKETIKEMELKEYLSAGKHVTKDTLQIRVLQKVIRILEKSNEDLKPILEREYIHPQVSTYLSNHIPYNYPTFSTDEQDLVLRIYSKDFHHGAELNEFSNLMDSKIQDPELRLHLNIAFGFDGYYGNNLSSYVKNLRYSLHEEANENYNLETKDVDSDTVARIVHLRAVRLLYEKFGVTPIETLNAVIQNAFDGVTGHKAKNSEMTNKYIGYVGSLFQDIRNLYHAPNISAE